MNEQRPPGPFAGCGWDCWHQDCIYPDCMKGRRPPPFDAKLAEASEQRGPDELRPDEWATIYVALKSRAHQLRAMAGEPQGISDETRKHWNEEAKRLDDIVAKLEPKP